MKTKNKPVSKQFSRKRGIAISIDALLAMILTIAFIGFIGLGLQQEEATTTTQAATNLSQTTNDAFAALDKSGVLANKLVDTPDPITTGTANSVYNEAIPLLPANTGLKVKINEYVPTDLAPTATCKTIYKDPTKSAQEKFDACFSTPTKIESDIKPIPTDKEVIHGRTIQITRQLLSGVDNKCTKLPQLPEAGTEAKNSEKTTALLQAETTKQQTEQKEAKNNEKQTALLAGENEVLSTEIVVTNTSNNPITQLECDQTARVTAKIRSVRRDPVAIMLAVDESESMGIYDMLQQQKTGTLNKGTCSGKVCGTECTNFVGNWVDVKKIYICQTLIDSIMQSNGGIAFMATTQSTGPCGPVPRLRIKSPDGTLYPNSDGTPTSARVMKSQLTQGDWTIQAWSDTQINSGVMLQIYWGAYETLPKINYNGNNGTIGSGTARGTGNECTNYTGYEKIGEYTPDDSTTCSSGTDTLTVKTANFFGEFYYTGYYGRCSNLSVKTQLPNGNYLSPAYGGAGCTTPNAQWDNCMSESTTSASGAYKIWAWSDYSMPYGQQYGQYVPKFYLYKIIYLNNDNIPAVDISGGTASGQYVACDNYDYTEIDSFNVDNVPGLNHLRGLQAKLDFGNLSTPYGGKCYPQKMKLTRDGTVLGVGNIYNRGGGCSDMRCRIFLDESDGQSYNYYPYAIVCRDNQVDGPECTAYPNTFPDDIPVNSGTYKVMAWNDSDSSVARSYTLSWNIQRIDAIKKSMKTFIDKLQDNWAGGRDMLGALSYSNGINLTSALTTDLTGQNTVRDYFLDKLNPNGQTAIADAIKNSAAMLTATEMERKTKVMILLTDGKANICEASYCTAKLGACEADRSCSEGDAAQSAIEQADSARQEGITVYVIGFADKTAIQTGGYEETLETIAKDRDKYSSECKNASGEPIPEKHCGKYWFAEDEDALKRIFGILKETIKPGIESLDVSFPLPSGMQLADPSSPGKYGEWKDAEDGIGDFVASRVSNIPADSWNESTNTLLVEKISNIDYSGKLWFATQFDVTLPCDGVYCEQEYVLFPPVQAEDTDAITKIIEKSGTFSRNWLISTEGYCDPSSGKRCYDNYLKIPFRYKDLSIEFPEDSPGTINADDTVSLNLIIKNNGHLPISTTAPTLKIEFTKGQNPPALTVSCSGGCSLSLPFPASIRDATVSPNGDYLSLSKMNFCASKPTACTGSVDTAAQANITSIKVSGTGFIYAQIDKDNGLKQCKLNDSAGVRCEAKQRFKFYTIDYYVWRE